MERLCGYLRDSQYLRAFSNGIKVVAEKYFAVLKNSYETTLIVQFRALNIFHRMELSWLGFNQRQPAMLGILARISNWILEDGLPFSIDLCCGTLECEFLRITIQLLQQGTTHAECQVSACSSFCSKFPRF